MTTQRDRLNDLAMLEQRYKAYCTKQETTDYLEGRTAYHQLATILAERSQRALIFNRKNDVNHGPMEE